MKTIKRHVRRCFFLFCAVLIFTFFDWLVHQSSPMLEVPTWYFTNKIIYGTVWACVTSFFVTKLSLPKQAAIITGITVTLLQIRYALYGYPLLFHAIVFPEHLFFLYFAAYYLLKYEKDRTFSKH